MDELGFNKIAAAVLATALGFMGLKEIAHSAMHVSAPDKPVYSVYVDETPDTGPVEVLPFPQPEWIAEMNADRGAKVFKKCTSCHNAEDGGAHNTGPNLWNIVGVPAGEKSGFNYSGAMANSGLTWDYETLNAYLEKPMKYLPGTKMNFVGLKKEKDRAAVIAYMRAQSPSPMAMPVPAIVDAALEATGDTLEAAVETAQDGLDAAAQTAEDGMTQAVETVQDGAADMKDAAEGALNDAADAGGKLVDDAKDMMDQGKDKMTPKTGEE